MSRRPNPTSGFTFFEVIIVVGLVGLLTAAVSQIFTSNHELADDTRAMQLVEAGHRRNIVAISRVLRGIDIQSLTGFDQQGISTNPHFGRVTGADLDDLTYAGDEQLVWMPYPVAVDGIVKPGAVYLVRDGRRVLVADRVPAGGFLVRQQGQNLVIHLTSFYVTSSGRAVQRTSETVVSIRN